MPTTAPPQRVSPPSSVDRQHLTDLDNRNTIAALIGDSSAAHARPSPVPTLDAYALFAAAVPRPCPSRTIAVASSAALAVVAGLISAALNLTPDGQVLTFNRAVSGPNCAHWRQAEIVELHRLLGTSNTSSPTMRAIQQSDLPSDRAGDVSYYNPQAREKLNDAGATTYRVRGTFGGDRCNYPFSAFAATASMVLVKMLLQSVVSDGSRFMTIDIKDYYLKTPMARPEYIRLRLSQLPPDIQSTYNLAQFVHNDSVLFEVTQTMYGLPQAGILSQQRLIAHLATSGYHQCPRTPCLFRHVANGITFTLVVDDFGVKYTSDTSVHHLIACLQSLYDLHIDWSGTKYLGMRYVWSSSSVLLSIPGYIDKALERFGKPVRGAASPAVHIPPQRGKGTQFAATDSSAPLAPADIKRVQEIVGVFLYYARCIDSRMLTAVNDIASCQSDLRASVLDKVDRLLAYASTHSDAQLELRACDMILHIQSDGSYLSRARSRSVNGGVFYLGDRDSPTHSNGPIFAVSSIIPVVVASAAEAELASLFMNAQHGAQLRTVLEDLGYPQPPTVILCDNSCAVGIAQNSIQQKHSKAIDMRFYWVQDRVAQGQFVVTWRAGITNLADYFTKALPVAAHEEIAPLFVYTPASHRTASNKSIARPSTCAFTGSKTASRKANSLSPGVRASPILPTILPKPYRLQPTKRSHPCSSTRRHRNIHPHVCTRMDTDTYAHTCAPVRTHARAPAWVLVRALGNIKTLT